MMPRKIPGTWELLLQPARQRPDADSTGRIPMPAISSRENYGSERARQDWSTRLLELMLSR